MSDQYKRMLSYFTLNKTIKGKRTLTFFPTEILIISWSLFKSDWSLAPGFCWPVNQHWQKRINPVISRICKLNFRIKLYAVKYKNWLGTSIQAKLPPTKYSIPQSFKADKRWSLISLQRTCNVVKNYFTILSYSYNPLRHLFPKIMSGLDSYKYPSLYGFIHDCHTATESKHP